jgi:large subunit ribosomal protein L29
MLAKDIREMSEADINARIADLERERFNLRLASGTRTLDDPLRLRVIRRDVARLRTVLQEKIIGIVEAREAGSGKRMVKARNVTGRRGRRAATATNRKKTSKRA